MLTDVGTTLAALLALAIILMGSRYLLDPNPAAAASLIPIADGAIVLRAGGPRATAYGIHWTTAALMLTVAVLLIV